MTKKIVIFGQGYLGSYLTAELSKDKNLEVIPIGRTTGIQYNKYQKTLKSGIDYFINCAGLVDVEACENDHALSLESNLTDFISFCDSYKPQHIINMSSYFVYDQNEEPFKTNYAQHKYLADEYTLQKDGTVMILGKLFGKSPKQQYRFPEKCLKEEVVYAEGIEHPFTYLPSVLVNIKNRIYCNKPGQKYTYFNFSKTPYEFACNLVTDRTLVKIPVLNSFEGYGNWLQSSIKLDEGVIAKYRKEMNA